MKKIKKNILYSISSFLAITTPIAVIVSCSKSSSPKNAYYDDKTISITVDGKQKEMWDYVISEFNKSDFHKKSGFKIKKITKDAFGALDNVKTLGYADDKVGDILYMPQDRLTDLIQQNAVRPFSKVEFDDIMNATGADEQEKKDAQQYGSAGKNIFAISHNVEGMIVASKEGKRSQLLSDLKTKGMLGIMNEAKALWRLQDLWYGAALFGSQASSKTDSAKVKQHKNNEFILYGDGSNWSSGFIKDDDHHQGFKKITDAMADMWFEPLAKAYNPKVLGTDPASQAWKANKVSEGDLKQFFNNNMGAVNTTLVQQLKNDKLDYMYLGTWDAQAYSKQGITELTNTINDLDGQKSSYLQNSFLMPKGTWSWAINARNNGVKPERIKAIISIIKLIYDKDALFKYFKKDTKVPFTQHDQDLVDEKIKSEKANIASKAASLYDKLKTKLKLSDVTSNQKDEIIYQKVKILFEYIDKIFINDQETQKSVDVGDWEISFSKDSFVKKDKANELWDTYKNYLYDSQGLKNMYKDLLSISDFKDGYKFFDKDIKGSNKLKNSPIYEKGGGIHIRKIAQSSDFLGFNNDSQDTVQKSIKVWFEILNKPNSKGEITKKILNENIKKAKSAFESWRDAIANKSISFRDKYFMEASGKTKANDKNSKLAVQKYLQTFWNKYLAEVIYKAIENEINSKNIIDSDSKTKMLLVAKISKESFASYSTSELFNVLSAQSGNKTYNQFVTQKNRFDNFNPQFGSVWEMWNTQTFGNKAWLQATITSVKNQDEFKEKVEEKLHKLFSDKVRQLKTANAKGVVDIYSE